MKKKPYTPTRTCPHRWCKPVHTAPVPFGLAIMAFDLWHNLWMLIAFGACLLGGIYLPKLIHFRPRQRREPATIKELVQDLRDSPSPIQMEIEDARYEGTGWRILEVRKWWARIAICCDLLLLTLTGVTAVAIFTDPAAEAQRTSSLRPDMGMVVGIVIALAFFGFTIYAHKKATQPRKPKRAWMPAFLRTNV